ncbi:hypothetical protein E8E13_002620 [Curvularia kusanoi]|uniref:Uncharacterized protein n=1 Tax=Curvularia kusanoi TaxID=90978 RepID=A0A9P4TAA4_CURKU|nr:hypothetical protein E8E13_002620 [Curvularia kusanoi]
MEVPSRILSIDIKDYKAAIEEWTVILERTHSWEMPQRVLLGPPATCPAEIEHDMIKMGATRLNTSREYWVRSDLDDQVLIDFLRKLPSLSDLEWRICNQLMPPLLKFLREEIPNCNLHLKPFDIDQDEDPSYVQSILSLPSLRTIWFKRNDFDGCEENIVQPIARAADGNLREVRIFWGFRGASPFPVPPPLMWRQKRVEPEGQRLGQVECLQLTGNGIRGTDETDLEMWARHTDLTHLRTLSLEFRATKAILETLVNLPLQSLRSLGTKTDWEAMSNDYTATLHAFISNITALSHLRIKGALPPRVLEGILDHLSPTLQVLYLIPGAPFDSSSIAEVTGRCNHVKELGISIRRAWNKPGEDIAVLKAIGRMPCLSDLYLTLDASDFTLEATETEHAPPDPSFSDFDLETFDTRTSGYIKLRNGNIRDALINSAIDADLVKAVFNTIISGTPDGETSSLRRLSLKAAGGGYWGENTRDSGVQMIVKEIGRGWVVERSDHNDVLEIRREERREELADDDDERCDLYDSSACQSEPIFRKIWPGNGDWWEEWHAFPLV